MSSLPRPVASALFGLVVLLLASADMTGPALLLLLLTWAVAVPCGTPGSRLVLAAIALTSLTTTWLLIATVVGRGPAASVLLVLLAMTPVLRRDRRPRQRATAIDAVSAGVTLVVVSVTALRFHSRGTAGHLTDMMGGEDHASHLSLLGGIREAGSYLYWASGGHTEGVFAGLLDYPQGLHGAASTVSRLAQPLPLTATELVEHYAVFSYVVFGLLVVALAECGLLLASRLGARGGGLLMAGAVPVLALWAGPAYSLIALGFITQVGSCCGLAALLLLTLTRPSQMPPLWRLCLAGAAVDVVAASWYILLPVAVVPAGLCVWQERTFVTEHPVLTVVLLAFLAALSLPHVVTSLLAGAARSWNALGGVVPVSAALLVCSACLPLLLTRRLWESWSATAGWCLTWLTALDFSAIIGALQIGSQGFVSYYYKSLYTFLLVSTVGVAALLGVMVTRPAAASSVTVHASWSSVALVSALVLLTTTFHAGTLPAQALASDRQEVDWDAVLRLTPNRVDSPSSSGATSRSATTTWPTG